MLKIAGNPSKTLKEECPSETVFPFEVESSTNFRLEEYFTVKMSGGKSFSSVYFGEKELLKAFYTERFYSYIGKEGCLLLDFMWSLGGE